METIEPAKKEQKLGRFIIAQRINHKRASFHYATKPNVISSGIVTNVTNTAVIHKTQLLTYLVTTTPEDVLETWMLK